MTTTVIVVGIVLGILVYKSWRFFVRALSGHRLDLWQTAPWHPVSTDGQQAFGFETVITVWNSSPSRECILTDATATLTLVERQHALAAPRSSSEVTIRHPRGCQPHGYWEAFVLAPNTSVALAVHLTHTAWADLQQLHALVVKIRLSAYGVYGVQQHPLYMVIDPHTLPFCEPHHTVAVPAHIPQAWQRVEHCADVLPIRTHLLSPGDDIADVVQAYVMPVAQPGDILAIAESALAIIQGRLRHIDEVRPGVLARLGCVLFPTTTSFGRPEGLQVLLETIGRPRFVVAMVVGQIAKQLRIRGVFYQCAGEQASLIDDVSGTLPPYDKFIVLGPERTPETCQMLKQLTHLDVAIVDICDIARNNRIVAHTAGTNAAFLLKALQGNPAGNGAEQTPLVLIRPWRQASQQE